MHDLIVCGGTVVDGTGADRYRADVAVKDGSIAAIGTGLGMARETIDAEGCIVTPGFIDIHTHFDAQVTWDDRLEPVVWHGVTTAIIGNCGVGFAPARPESRSTLIDMMASVEDIPADSMASAMKWNWNSYPDYLGVVDGHPKTIDIASMITYCTLRIFVMGARVHQNPTPADIHAMAELVREGMRAGAVGLSMSRTILHTTGDGTILPGTFAEEEELITLARAVREGGGGRGVLEVSPASTAFPEPRSLTEDVELLIRVSRASGCPVVFSLLQANHAPREYASLLERITAVGREGVIVHPSVCSRPISLLMSFQGHLHPFCTLPGYASLAHLPHEEKIAELRKPGVRATLLQERIANPSGLDLVLSDPAFWTQVFFLDDPIDYYPRAEASLQAEADRRGVDVRALAYDTMLQDDGRNFLVYAVTNWAERDRRHIHDMLTHPNALLGLGDAGAHLTSVVDGSQPTTLLADWTRTPDPQPAFNGIPLEFAIRKLSLDNAVAFGLGDRGVIARGKKADINVIDLARLGVERPAVGSPGTELEFAL